MQNLSNKLVCGLQILESTSKKDIEQFINVLFEHRTYGLTIATLRGQLDAEWGDWVVRFPDGTFGVISRDVWDKYITGNCKQVKR